MGDNLATKLSVYSTILQKF